MGVLDFLKPKSPVEKAAKQLHEPYAQPDVRQGAMDKLFDIGSDDAYAALVRRFSFSANGHTADESEKRTLVQRLISVGDDAVAPLQRYIETEKAITYPIQALRGILPQAEAKAFLVRTLEAYEPQDHRSTQAKATLIVSIAEVIDASEAGLFAPYLDDHSDDVQFQAIAAIESLKNPEASAELIKVCTSDEHAPRIQRRAAQALAHLEVNVRAKFEEFAHELRDEYALDKKGRLQKRGAAS